MNTFKLPGYENEKIILLSHKHWFYHYKTVSIVVLGFILPIIISLLIVYLGVFPRVLGLFFSIYYLVLVTFAFQEWVRHNYETLILTPRELVEVDQDGIIIRRIVQINLKDITNITAKINTFMGSLFRFGDLAVELKKELIVFSTMPNPIVLARAIMEAHNKIDPNEAIHEHGAPKAKSSEITEFTTKSYEEAEVQGEAVMMASKERLKQEAVFKSEAKILAEEIGKNSGAKPPKPKPWIQIVTEQIFGKLKK